jgi:hypothetical protein
MASLIYQPNSDTIPSIKIQPQSLPAHYIMYYAVTAVLISAYARQKLLISYVL